jgi:hypothetical protein
MRAFIHAIRSVVWTFVRAVKLLCAAFVSKQLCARTASSLSPSFFFTITGEILGRLFVALPPFTDYFFPANLVPY